MTEQTYRIGEAARLLNLESYVLRFWETEFSQLRPARTPKGQRLYSETDMELLRRIRFLLHEQGMTIEGARRVLACRDGCSEMSPAVELASAESDRSIDGDTVRKLRSVLAQVERELRELQQLIRSS